MTPAQPGRAVLWPLFLISAGAVGFEIALTRYFAVAKWSEYGYWVISIVMVGFALSGVLLALARDAFSRHGIDTSRFTKLQQKNATTGTDLWSLVNGMTNFASNGKGIYFDDETQRSRIMVAAGNLFARDTYDTENLVVSPFSRERVEVATGDQW